MAFTKILTLGTLCLCLVVVPSPAQERQGPANRPASGAKQRPAAEAKPAAASASAAAQATGAPTTTTEASRKADAYYNFSMGHLYSELSSVYGNRREFVDQAIQYYREALKADPEATFLTGSLSELYLRAGRVSEAVTEAEKRLAANPDDLDARRVLGRIYTRLIGEPGAAGG
nr:tetratricopeptide repeat protein [Bryobacterales bacterium]